MTRFLGERGVAEISDFMAMEHLGHSHNLVRRVKVVRGEIRFRMRCAPKFDYARAGHRIEKKPREILFLPEGKNLPALRLRCGVPVRVENGEVRAEFRLRAGQSVAFILEEAGRGESPSQNPDYVPETFKETMNFWLAWVSRSKYRGRWREMVNRSALTLKLLTSQPARLDCGVADVWVAGNHWRRPQLGLPLHLDPRCLLHALCPDAPRLSRRSPQRSCNGSKLVAANSSRAAPCRSCTASTAAATCDETILKHFEGYRKSAPVRIGNAAHKQLQLDIYGELMDSVFIYDHHDEPISYDFWTNLTTLVEWVCANWRKPDEGIWEVRGGARPFLYSRVLCWVALDRAMKLAQRRSFPAPLVRWHRIRDQIYTSINEQFWNKRLHSFVQYRGAKTVDASSLLLPLVKFISPTDPRWMSTLNAIEKDLVEDSLVYRYLPPKAAPDGISGHEGTFSMCSFWYVECLARANDLKKARFIFEKALGYANHLGLYAEQLGPCGEHLGNFPQALSHIALISAAWSLDDRLSHAA